MIILLAGGRSKQQSILLYLPALSVIWQINMDFMVTGLEDKMKVDTIWFLNKNLLLKNYMRLQRRKGTEKNINEIENVTIKQDK